MYSVTTYSLPDPVPLDKDSDGNPVRVDIPEPLIGAHQQDDYVTVSGVTFYLYNTYDIVTKNVLVL